MVPQDRQQQGRSSGQGVRYFVLRSSTMANIQISIRVGAWATTRSNEEPLDHAFRTSREVRLIFSVNGSNAFHGYAVMRTPVGRFPRPVIWENGKQFGNPFAVEWRVIFDLPFSDCDHIRNPFNHNKAVFVGARDGTEIPQQQGDMLVRLMEERARSAGVKVPRQPITFVDTRSNMQGRGGMPGPGGRGMGGRGPAGGRGAGPMGGAMGAPGMDPLMAMGAGMPGLMGGAGMGVGVNPMEQLAALAMGGAMNPMLQQGLAAGLVGGLGVDQQAAAQALLAAGMGMGGMGSAAAANPLMAMIGAGAGGPRQAAAAANPLAAALGAAGAGAAGQGMSGMMGGGMGMGGMGHGQGGGGGMGGEG